MSKQEEFVLRTVEDRDVRFIRLWFSDVLGRLKSVAIVPAELEGSFGEGIGFDGSAVEGLSRVFEADMVLKPDPSTFSLLPWRGEEEPTGRMFCDIISPDGGPAMSDPRNVLKRTMDRAAALGFTFYVHPEIEFYLFQSGELNGGLPIPVDSAGYFDHVNGGTANDFRRTAVQTLEAMGISVEFSHHEAGPGQNEIDLRYADSLTMADNVMTFRAMVKEVAAAQGVYASFMPKPLADQPGNGMHTHVSLFEGEENAFYSPSGDYQLSTTGRQFVAGLLRHAPEISAVTNQYVNSYKRLWTGHEAPSYICWGHRNRSALIRVPQYKSGKSSSARIEFRGLDSSANPYLAYSLILAAGLKGIEEGYELPPEAEDDVWLLSDGERRALGIEAMPASLNEAIIAMENSELVAQTLGEEVFDYFLRNKRKDWEDYRAQVTQFELSRDFSSL
ncbi:glutamine synthetase family protein [Brevibacterium sp. 50QC2O2]|uniref:glutamine synthetase family protein n=1 Tax=Brevibacterium TaxID=1696 RepID=UPI00211C99AA|nr:MULTISPECIES: glutamine synthetase family protein [unclassified Brevibacterium]MCQ9366669.1 glutamine synthetase family protein [Brevibacterium sp. 91QC2O2]MCQ9384354.1 glutamine synthetase family protein [Brevibacterium sp. 68QC2CO]MCQ9389591.1 glutamine synthetase family protein [Brevibacterium sp. 50QC2O2]